MGDKNRRTARNPVPLIWEFPPHVPTDDFLAGLALDNPKDLRRAVDKFLDYVEQELFHSWEAVVCEELGRKLTADQRELLEDLADERDDPSGAILRIDGRARPSEPWYVLVNRIVPHLLVEPFVTTVAHTDLQLRGWEQIAESLSDYGHDLSLPADVASVAQVVPAAVRDRLWLQFCFHDLEGLGAEADSSLAHDHERYRVESLVECLQKHKASVRRLQLTFDSLLTRLIVPDTEVPHLRNGLRDSLGITSDSDPIASFL